MDSNIYVTVSSVEVGVVIQDGAVIDTEITAVGPKGDQGDIGETGATGATGTSLRNLGTWSSATAYVNNASYTDLVYYNGSYYACKVSNTNQVPTNTTYWDLIVSKGDTGATGPSGVGFTETGYYPVDYNSFTTTGILLAAGTVVPLVKKRGTIPVASNTMTLAKGYAYEFILDYDLAEGAGSGGFILFVYNSATSANLSDWGNKKYSVAYNQTTNGSSGYAFVDLTSASSDIAVQIKCGGIAGSPTLTSGNGGCYVRKLKKVSL